MAHAGPPVRAVLWDFGGVLTTSPFDAFAAYESSAGLPAGFIRRLNATNPDTNAWAQLERGELPLDGFAARFEEEATADKTQASLEAVYREGKTLTRDVHGTAGTKAFADAIVAAIV